MLTAELLEEIAAGQGETLTRAARRIPRTRQDRAVTIGCLLRWVMAGVLAPDGQRIYLEGARMAGRWVTTPAALQRFIAAQNLPPASEQPPAPRSPTKRRRACERARKELKRKGI
jgi:hypothetical protein